MDNIVVELGRRPKEDHEEDHEEDTNYWHFNGQVKCSFDLSKIPYSYTLCTLVSRFVIKFCLHVSAGLVWKVAAGGASERCEICGHFVRNRRNVTFTAKV